MDNRCGWLFIVAGLLLLVRAGELTWMLYLIPIALIITGIRGWLCRHEADHHARNSVA